ncbi:MAG: hypothetical protein EXS05_17705, partial [Planctomycetaceae bacterium]|nr:hypothetical protein [Planctomycetaceae bacterium]
MSLKEKYGKPANNGHAKPAFDADDVNARLAAEPIDDSPVPRFEEPAGWEFDGGARYTRQAGAGEQPQREAGDDETQPEHGGGKAKAKLRRYSFRELMAEFPTLSEVAIGFLLRIGEVMNIVAPPKRGKSWLVAQLILCVATGQDWLGRFATRKGKVLLVDNEL